MSEHTTESETKYTLPSVSALQHASRKAIVEDKPILLDYWTSSCDNTIIIGVRENGEKLLVKNEEEYTSPIQKIFKIDSEYLIMTENSLYIISSSIQTKRIA
jgi:hypothetical protein